MTKNPRKNKPTKVEELIYSPRVLLAGGCLVGISVILSVNAVISHEKVSEEKSYAVSQSSPSSLNSISSFNGFASLNTLSSFNASPLNEFSSQGLIAKSSEKPKFKKEPREITHFGMRCKETFGITFEVDYLFWKAQADGLGYAANIPGWLPSEDISHINKVFTKEQSSKWGSGFRLGIGENLSYDLWDVGFDWTYFNHRNTSHTRSNTSSIVPTTLVNIFNTSNTLGVNQASSSWHLRFSMMDLDLGRKFLIGDHFTVRPNAGLKGGWINQIQSIFYSELDTIDFGAIPRTRVKKINDFGGIGPELGMDLRWLLGHQFGIFGTMSTALLYGHFDIETKFFFFNSSITNIPTVVNDKNRLRPMLQLLLGLDWEKCFGKTKFGLGAGYELQYWWSQEQNSVDVFSTPPSGSGDLTLRGLTARAKFEF